jgi:alginate O-acetyltransferase complex protein AlgJ
MNAANLVVAGSGGFLFQTHDEAFEQLCLASLPSDRKLAHWANQLESNLAWCEARGVRFVSLVLPERHVIHANRLPAGVTASPDRALCRLLAMMDPASRRAVLYPEQALRSANQLGEVFLQTDEHLNLRGYYACYHALLDHLGTALALRPMPPDALATRRLNVSGNLGMHLESEPTEDLDIWLARAGTTRIFTKHGGAGRFEIFHTDDRTLPKAVVYGDSNADAMRHILTPHFSRTLMVYNCHQLFHELVRREQPDVVIHVMSELRLGRTSHEGAATLDVIDTFFEQRAGPLPSIDTMLAVDFDACGQSEPMLDGGWSECEDTHTWMTGAISRLRLPVETVQALTRTAERHWLELLLVPKLDSRHHRQRLTISYGWQGAWTSIGDFTLREETWIRAPLPALTVPPEQMVFLRFEHADGFAPSEFGGTDQRVMSFAARRMSIVAEQR